MNNTLLPHLEALIFASEHSISEEELLNVLLISHTDNLSLKDIRSGLAALKEKYESEESALELAMISGGYQFLTKKQFHPAISILQQQASKKKLGQAALETLSIVAYKQPVTKTEIEQIRGVNCDYAIQKLLEKELILISGKSEAVGRPLLYVTSQMFMDHFGIGSMAELPQLKDLAPADEGSMDNT